MSGGGESPVKPSNTIGQSSGPLRRAVFIVGAIETLAMAYVAVKVIAGGQLTSGEALSRSIGWAVLTIYGLPYLLCVVPALLLAVYNRLLPLALAMCAVVAPIMLFVVFIAA